MVGSYAQVSNGLELRRPAHIFIPLAWLIAGPLNPAGYFAYMPWSAWDAPYSIDMWATSVALPLSIGCAISLSVLRDGGFGGLSLALITFLAVTVGCAISGPLNTLLNWTLAQFGIYWTTFTIFDFGQAMITSGTFIQMALCLMAVPIIPAIALLRLIAFRREARRPRS